MKYESPWQIVLDIIKDAGTPLPFRELQIRIECRGFIGLPVGSTIESVTEQLVKWGYIKVYRKKVTKVFDTPQIQKATSV